MKNINFIYLILLLITMIGCHSEEPETNKAFNIKIAFEKSNGKSTSTYSEMMAFYKAADQHSDKLKMSEHGITDSGLALHVATYSNDPKNENDLQLLINNGIHPGEPDGIDASMLLIKDLINGEFKLPDDVVLHIIPSYNLGGMVNRNSTSRANQNGPEAYGFRGNARNYDLNRDFIKMDTDNMRAFADIYHDLDPDVYVETHVSNGADYQYTLTHLLTQHDRLGHQMGEYIDKTFKPQLERSIREKDLLITPYVNVFGRTPEEGFSQFVDSPRYSTGYTALWNTLGLLIETHMLKPYPKRVNSTNAMLESIIELSARERDRIKSLRASNFDDFQADEYYGFDHQIDSTQYETLDFKGYEADTITSSITGQPRLKYYQSRPFEKNVPYYDHLKANDSLLIPAYYVIPKAWQRVINRLKTNQVKMQNLKKDSIIKVESYRIAENETSRSAYEGHYLHFDTRVNASIFEKTFSKGDLLIPTDQKARKYLLEVLEPELKDSFFNWNFFDSILQRKEGFSPYVFEDYAVSFLEEHPGIKKDFETKKANEPAFSKDAYAQLLWIYKRTPLYEKAHLQYPIYRILPKKSG